MPKKDALDFSRASFGFVAPDPRRVSGCRECDTFEGEATVFLLEKLGLLVDEAVGIPRILARKSVSAPLSADVFSFFGEFGTAIEDADCVPRMFARKSASALLGTDFFLLGEFDNVTAGAEGEPRIFAKKLTSALLRLDLIGLGELDEVKVGVAP